MHESSLNLCREFITKYLANKLLLSIADVGSLDVNGSYRTLFAREGWSYTGFDIAPGPNVNVCLQREDLQDGVEYHNRYDVVISGQTVEHVRRPWNWIKGVAQLAKPGGIIWITGPNNWPYHEYPIDAWRIWPEGLRALFEDAGLEILELGQCGTDTFGVAQKRQVQYDTGLVISTFAATPYVHLQLELAKRYSPGLPILVIDDGSYEQSSLQQICSSYKANFICRKQRMGHVRGDMMSFVEALEWGKELGLELVVKFSRRWIPLREWLNDLLSLKRMSDAATYSNRCVWHGFGFRSECVGMNVRRWLTNGESLRYLKDTISETASLAPHLVSGATGMLVEAIIHRAAYFASANGSSRHAAWKASFPDVEGAGNYVPWPLMGVSRVDPRSDVLWHEWARPIDYHRAAILLGIDRYKLDDFVDSTANTG